jgi:hypothetical protein
MTPRLERSNLKGRKTLVDYSLRRVVLLAIGIVLWISGCSTKSRRAGTVVD